MEPQTIVDQPVPLLGGGQTAPTGNNTNPVVIDTPVPTTQVDRIFPPAIVAVDTIGSSINTETKSILGQFTFESLGAISIGTFSQGVSGNIKISPNGIVAVNVNGTTTFALDGTTGNATFLGTLQAGTLIAGDSNVVIGVGGSGGGRIVLYNSGVAQILIGDST